MAALALAAGAAFVFAAALVWLSAAAPLTAQAQAPATYNPLQFTPQVPISGSAVDQTAIAVGSYNPETGTMTSDLLAKYIKAFYDYGLAAAGILAAIVLMAGGLLWLTAAGNDTRIGQAKELIVGSITGVLILFSSWIILNTINPDLLQLKVINTKISPTLYLNIGCCQNNTTNKAFNSTSQTCGGGNTFYAGKIYDEASQSCQTAGCCVYSTRGQAIADASKQNLNECSQSTQAGCGQHSNWFTFKNQACSAIADCAGAALTGCEQRANGSSCGSSTLGFCYDQICLINTQGQKVGDKCGTYKGAQCLTPVATPFSPLSRSCPDNYDWVANWTHDDTGRDCASGLRCCYPD